MCVEAGAVGVVVINSEENYLTMPVVQGTILDTTPFLLVTASNGEAIVRLLGGDDDDDEAGHAVTLESGRGVAASAPLDGFSLSSPLSSIRIDTMAPETTEDLPFAFVRRGALSEDGAYVLVYDDTATYHIVSGGEVIDSKAHDSTIWSSFDDFYDEVFSFVRLGEEGSEYLLQQGLNSFGIFTLPADDPLNPETVSSTVLENIPCDRNIGNVVAVGGGQYLYVTGGLVREESDACPATVFNGENFGAVRH